MQRPGSAKSPYKHRRQVFHVTHRDVEIAATLFELLSNRKQSHLEKLDAWLFKLMLDAA